MATEIPPVHEHSGHKEGEWRWDCCACGTPDVGCAYCLETYYRENSPETYALVKGSCTCELVTDGVLCRPDSLRVARLNTDCPMHGLLLEGGQHAAAEPGSDEQQADGQSDPHRSLRGAALAEDQAGEHAGDEQQDEADSHESGSGPAGLGAGVPHVGHEAESTGQREADLRPYLRVIDEVVEGMRKQIREDEDSMTITEFLHARIAEDEREATVAESEFAHGGYGSFSPARVLAECEAKRAIIAQHEQWPVLVSTPPVLKQVADFVDNMTYRATQQLAWVTEREYVARFGVEPPTAPMIRTLAAVYADHPDYREEWKL